MKALVFDGSLHLEEINLPQPRQDEALIRVKLAGICNTDLEITKGYMDFSGVLGHEFVGVVDLCSDETLIGKRVVGEINVACGSCEYCMNGMKKHCSDLSVIGINNRDGCFAEFVVLPIDNLHLIPETVPDEEATFVEPLAAAYHVFESVWVKPSSMVLIIGDGKLGLLISMAASSLGIEHTMVGRHPERFAMLDSNVNTISSEGQPDLKSCYDIVIEATGNEQGMALALSAVKPAGTIVLKSTYSHIPNVDLSRVAVNELKIVGSRCGRFEDAIRFLEKKSVKPVQLIDRIFPFDNALEAFDYAPGHLKVLLRM
ncbi:MAG TPA: alcohol dehydrogenase [Kosmotogaceae bacterium]|nr:alcohol dehydrogenase [Kosmotogaceae bacterium]